MPKTRHQRPKPRRPDDAAARLVRQICAGLGIAPGDLCPELQVGETRPPSERGFGDPDPHGLGRAYLEDSPSPTKKTGAFYTPPPIAQLLATRTLSLLEPYDGQLPTVLDPACGCGALLLASLEHLVIRGGLTPQDAAQCLRGHDKDLGAVLVTRAALLLLLARLGASERDLPDLAAVLAHSITERDVLRDPPTPGADCVIANPPYVRAARRGDRHRQLRDSFVTARGAFDLQIPFMELALRTVRDGGAAGLLVSNKFLVADYGRALRRYIDENATVRELIDLTDCDGADPGALVNQIIVVAERTAPPDDHAVLVSHPQDVTAPPKPQLRPQHALLGERWPVLRATDAEQRLLGKMLDDTTTLGDVALVRGGVRGFDYTACCEQIREATDESSEVPVLTPGNVRAYAKEPGGAVRLRGTSWTAPVLATRPQAVSEALWDLFHAPKLVIKGVASRPAAAFAGGPTALMVAVWGAWGEETLLWTLLGLLNSHAAAWLHHQQLSTARIPKGSHRVPLSWVRRFPVPRSGLDELAERVSCHVRSGADGQASIDASVSRAYGLTEADTQLMAKVTVPPHTR